MKATVQIRLEKVFTVSHAMRIVDAKIDFVVDRHGIAAKLDARPSLFCVYRCEKSVIEREIRG